MGPGRRSLVEGATPASLGTVFPGDVLAQGGRIISAQTPVPYLRTKIASCVPDTRLMATKFCLVVRRFHQARASFK
jgi:hypothetical protein